MELDDEIVVVGHRRIEQIGGSAAWVQPAPGAPTVAMTGPPAASDALPPSGAG